jgi:hypothetical protein
MALAAPPGSGVSGAFTSLDFALALRLAGALGRCAGAVADEEVIASVCPKEGCALAAAAVPG